MSASLQVVVCDFREPIVLVWVPAREYGHPIVFDRNCTTSGGQVAGHGDVNRGDTLCEVRPVRDNPAAVMGGGAVPAGSE